MSAITRQTVEATLRQYQDPYLNQDPVDRKSACRERV